MNDIQLYYYEGKQARIIMIDGKAWWVAKDVCDILGYANVTKALNDHLDEDERNTLTIREGIRGNPNVNIISESGLYTLILRSNMPKAKEFRKWVTGTVLPQVMREGLNNSPINAPTQVDPMQAAKLILEAAGIKDNQLALALDKVAKHYTGYSLLALSGVTLIAPTKCQLLTPTEIGKHFGVSGRKINEILCKEGYQVRDGKSYEPLEMGEPFAVMVDAGKRHSDGSPVRQLKWESTIVQEIDDLFGYISMLGGECVG